MRLIPLELLAFQIVGFSVLYTWLFNSTDGNLVFPHLFHTANNFTFFVFPVLPAGPGDSGRPLWIGIGLLWVVVFVTGHETLSRSTSRITYINR